MAKKVTLERIREIARKIKKKFLDNPSADLKELIIDVLLDGNSDLKENHIRTLVHIVNNLIFFTLTKELNTTAVRFKSVPDEELLEAYADRVRAIKEQLMAKAKEKEKQRTVVKAASEVNVDIDSNITVDSIERMKSTYRGKYIEGLPIQFSDFWRNFIEINEEEKHANFINPTDELYRRYRPLIEELEKLGVDLDYKKGSKHIITVAKQTEKKLFILKNELMGKLIENTSKLYDIIKKLKKTISHITSMSFMGHGANLDILYTITKRRYQNLDSLAEPVQDIPLDFDVPENDLISFDKVMNYIIDEFKKSGKISPTFELTEIDTIESYAIDNPSHPYWKVISKYIQLANERKLILKQAREVQNILDSISDARGILLSGGQL